MMLRNLSLVLAVAAATVASLAISCGDSNADESRGGGAASDSTVVAPPKGDSPVSPKSDPPPEDDDTSKPEEPPVPAPTELAWSDGEYISFENGLRVYPELGRVEMRANLIGGQSRPLEFLVVAYGGAEHEAVFSVAAKGEHLKRGLEICGLNEAKEKTIGRGYIKTPGGDAVRISVRFLHAESGKVTTVRVEDWLWDVIEKAPPKPVGFAFTGSIERYMEDTNRSSFDGDFKGNLVALYRDSSCVLDNARPNGAMPDCYQPKPDADGMPRPGSEVILVYERETK